MVSKSGSRGGPFEREVSKKLSLWWSNGEHDDLFWRSSASGARATQRAKVGKRTIGHAGDIAATAADSAPLTQLVNIECKKGYTTRSPYDLIDYAPGNSISIWERWMAKAHKEHEKIKTYGWWLITRRNRCVPMITMPWDLVQALEIHRAAVAMFKPVLRIKEKGELALLTLNVGSLQFDNFLNYCNSDHARKICKEWSA